MFALAPMAWLVLMLIIMRHAAARERLAFNAGECPSCRRSWRRYDVDSQGGRGYTCDGCKRGVWVSYSGIDDR